ncbi:MAG: histidine kinase [Saprospiraceae bacterium]
MKLFWLAFPLFLLTACVDLDPYLLDITYDGIEHRAAGSAAWLEGSPSGVGVYEVGLDVTIDSPVDSLVAYALLVSQLASAEAYFDGRYLGTNGIVGTSAATETPGQIDYMYMLPTAWLTPGKHRVLFKTSNYHADGRVRFYGAFITHYERPVRIPLTLTAFLHLYAGMFLVIGLFFGFRFLISRRDWSLLAFTIICLAFFALLIVEYIRSYYLYPYPWHFTRLQIILGLSWLISSALPLFFVLRFGMRVVWWAVALLVVVFGVLLFATWYGYDPATNVGMIAGFWMATGVCILAERKNIQGAKLALAGVLPVAIALPLAYRNYDIALYVGFGYLVITVLISLVLREREETRLRETALLRSSRLKLQLLKKSIQPHFLMNSIASAIDWIEEHPARGVDLLLALSEEFRILLDSADENLIPLEREIALCQAHLTVMSFRKLARYELQTELVISSASIPPAILLTFLENGISHQSGERSAADPLSFTLKQALEGKQLCYRFFSPGDAKEPVAGRTKGTGLSYVEARLQENYGDSWTMSYGPVRGGWETIVSVPA